MSNSKPLILDEDTHRVSTLIFATPPIDYVAETAEYWAELGFRGFLRPDVMNGWQADIWELDGGTRIEGEANPRFKSIRRMVERLTAVGVDENFIVVPFSKHVPDWFNDAAWATVAENLRQCARFARMAGFRGIALDDEYIEDQWGLHWSSYVEAGHTADSLLKIARQRGRELQSAMLGEYPDMVSLHLPECWSIHGELSKEMFLGCLDALTEVDAPGGMHLLPEQTYFMQEADWVARLGYGLDRALMDDLPESLGDYWVNRCGIGLGLAPLGYLRFIRDEQGRRLGYGGRADVFGDRILEMGEDKSGNYSAETFAETYAAARMVSRGYIWVFAGGPVWWQMTEDQRERHGGSNVATLPLIDDFDRYTESIRTPKRIDTPLLRELERGVSERVAVDSLDGLGMPLSWCTIGPFSNEGGIGYKVAYSPESDLGPTGIHSGITGHVRWQHHDTPPMGYVDLSRLIAGGVDICGYALTRFDLESEIDAVIRFGSDDAGRIRLNGTWIHGIDTERIGMPDEDTIPVLLPAGRNEVLLKICNYHGGWGFYFRITDEAGEEIPGIRWEVA
jgi:hypothetical protein